MKEIANKTQNSNLKNQNTLKDGACESYIRNCDAYAQINSEHIEFLKVDDLNTDKMGMNCYALRVFEKLMELARKSKTVTQAYIAQCLKITRATVNKHINFMVDAGYIEPFYAKDTDLSLSYKINYKYVLSFLNIDFIKENTTKILNLTQWVSKTFTSIRSIHSSLINKSLISKDHANKEKSDEKKELNNLEKDKDMTALPLDDGSGQSNKLNGNESFSRKIKQDAKELPFSEYSGGQIGYFIEKACDSIGIRTKFWKRQNKCLRGNIKISEKQKTSKITKQEDYLSEVDRLLGSIGVQLGVVDHE